ncbi:caspase-3 [Plakobranchus ocellatus]|uniref:Caspase-3 n=1 Tax=Plakobranchus ocellatus TaxID=259542 RepID=A0AAV4CJR8_9GAST|nr:caspase-3 [Plakobranchus ocellatus]
MNRKLYDSSTNDEQSAQCQPLESKRVDLASNYQSFAAFEAKCQALKPNLGPRDCMFNDIIITVECIGERGDVRPGAQSEPNEYNFNYKKRGLFLLINNRHFDEETGQHDREGSDVDAERLEERFQDLGFEVRRYDDVTCSKMSSLLYNGRRNSRYLDPHSLGRIPSRSSSPGSPSSSSRRSPVSPNFTADDDMPEPGSQVHMRRIPVEADCLFCYSTVPGSYAWRNNQDGSWFIQALCIVLENYGTKMELMHMLTHVNRIVAYEFASCAEKDFGEHTKQLPCTASMLTRYVYFRPKKQDIR